MRHGPSDASPSAIQLHQQVFVASASGGVVGLSRGKDATDTAVAVVIAVTAGITVTEDAALTTATTD